VHVVISTFRSSVVKTHTYRFIFHFCCCFTSKAYSRVLGKRHASLLWAVTYVCM